MPDEIPKWIKRAAEFEHLERNPVSLKKKAFDLTAIRRNIQLVRNLQREIASLRAKRTLTPGQKFDLDAKEYKADSVEHWTRLLAEDYVDGVRRRVTIGDPSREPTYTWGMTLEQLDRIVELKLERVNHELDAAKKGVPPAGGLLKIGPERLKDDPWSLLREDEEGEQSDPPAFPAWKNAAALTARAIQAAGQRSISTSIRSFDDARRAQQEAVQRSMMEMERHAQESQRANQQQAQQAFARLAAARTFNYGMNHAVSEALARASREAAAAAARRSAESAARAVSGGPSLAVRQAAEAAAQVARHMATNWNLAGAAMSANARAMGEMAAQMARSRGPVIRDASPFFIPNSTPQGADILSKVPPINSTLWHRVP